MAPELLAQVARGVVDSWSASNGVEERDALLSKRPYISRELDRALLVDLSARLGVYDIDEGVRHALRDQFWDLVASQPQGAANSPVEDQS